MSVASKHLFYSYFILTCISFPKRASFCSNTSSVCLMSSPNGLTLCLAFSVTSWYLDPILRFQTRSPDWVVLSLSKSFMIVAFKSCRLSKEIERIGCFSINYIPMLISKVEDSFGFYSSISNCWCSPAPTTYILRTVNSPIFCSVSIFIILANGNISIYSHFLKIENITKSWKKNQKT